MDGFYNDDFLQKYRCRESAAGLLCVRWGKQLGVGTDKREAAGPTWYLKKDNLSERKLMPSTAMSSTKEAVMDLLLSRLSELEEKVAVLEAAKENHGGRLEDLESGMDNLEASVIPSIRSRLSGTVGVAEDSMDASGGVEQQEDTAIKKEEEAEERAVKSEQGGASGGAQEGRREVDRAEKEWTLQELKRKLEETKRMFGAMDNRYPLENQVTYLMSCPMNGDILKTLGTMEERLWYLQAWQGRVEDKVWDRIRKGGAVWRHGLRSRPEERKIRAMMIEEAERLRRGSSLGLLWMAEAEARGLQLAEEEPDYGGVVANWGKGVEFLEKCFRKQVGWTREVGLHNVDEQISRAMRGLVWAAGEGMSEVEVTASMAGSTGWAVLRLIRDQVEKKELGDLDNTWRRRVREAAVLMMAGVSMAGNEKCQYELAPAYGSYFQNS